VVEVKHTPAALADDRPRVHIWTNAQGFFWSSGAVGTRFYEPTLARALAAGIKHIGPVPAVIIIEARE
jgi:hypothetical protein